MAFAGGAYAATKEAGANPRQAFLDDVAQRLSVSPSQLSSALEGAFLDQLQAAVAGGRITQAQARAIEQHAHQSGSASLRPWQRLGQVRRRWPGAQVSGAMAAAAGYLGVSSTQLLEQLSAGKSLAQVAAARGKSVAGLKDAITAAVRARLDKLVAAKLIGDASERQLLAKLSSALDREINHTGVPPRSGTDTWLGPRRRAMGMAHVPAPAAAPGVAPAAQPPVAAPLAY